MCPETFLLGWFNVCLLHLVLVHVHLFLLLHLASSGDTLRYYPNIKHPNENKTKREKIHRSKTTCQLQILGIMKWNNNSVIQFVWPVYLLCKSVPHKSRPVASWRSREPRGWRAASSARRSSSRRRYTRTCHGMYLMYSRTCDLFIVDGKILKSQVNENHCRQLNLTPGPRQV